MALSSRAPDCTWGTLRGFLLLLGFILLSGCSEPPSRLQRKLESTLQDDLRYMVAEVERASGKKNLRSNPYYVIQDLRLYSGDSAYKFAGYADVYFFYYSDSIPMAQERKYRYDTGKRFWDRYFKKVMFLDQVPKQLKEIDSTKGP